MDFKSDYFFFKKAKEIKNSSADYSTKEMFFSMNCKTVYRILTVFKKCKTNERNYLLNGMQNLLKDFNCVFKKCKGNYE